jgi:hypothetical protein
MPPPSKAKDKETNELRASRLERKVLEIRHRDSRVKISECMKRRPDCMPALVSLLMSLGVLTKNMDVVEIDGLTPVRKPKKALDRDGGPSDSGGDDDDGGADGAGFQSLGGKMNEKFTKVDNMPNCHLEKWLSKLEPISLSPQMLKLVILRGARLQTHSHLKEIFEFCTLIDPGFLLFSGRTAKRVEVHGFEERMVQDYIAGPRYGRDLNLADLDWDRDGVYIVIVNQSDCQYYLKNKRTGETAKIPVELNAGINNVKEFKIALNFSPKRAILNGAGPLNYKRCDELISEAGAAESSSTDQPRKRIKLAAIKDGVLASVEAGAALTAKKSPGASPSVNAAVTAAASKKIQEKNKKHSEAVMARLSAPSGKPTKMLKIVDEDIVSVGSTPLVRALRGKGIQPSQASLQVASFVPPRRR